MRRDTRPTGHRLIDNAALNGEVRRPGQTVRDGDVIAVGVGCAKAEREMMAAAKTASLVHGYDVVTQALACESEFGLQFLAWLQGREHAGRPCATLVDDLREPRPQFWMPPPDFLPHRLALKHEDEVITPTLRRLHEQIDHLTLAR